MLTIYNDRKLTLLYYFLYGAYRLFTTMKFPILTLFLLSEDISIIQIGVGYSLMSLAVVLSDTPLGYLADKTNEKAIFIGGILIEALSAYFFSQSSTVTLMYISFIFWGIGISTFSGVLEGWYVNNSNRIGTTIKQSHVFSRVRSISNICTFFGILTSSILTTMFSYELTLIIISVLLVIYSVFSSFILNNSLLEKEKNNHNISFKEYFSFIFNVNFIRVLLFFSILGFIYSGYAAIWMPVFESVLGSEINHSLIINSLIYGSIYLLSGLAIIYFSKLLNVFVDSILKQVVVLRMLFASSFFLMAITNQNIFLFSISTLLMFIFGDLEYGPLSEIKNSFLNNNNRIFGLSVFSTCERVLASLGGFIITALYSNFGTSVAFILVSLLTLLSLLAVTPLIEKNNKMKVC